MAPPPDSNVNVFEYVKTESEDAGDAFLSQIPLEPQMETNPLTRDFQYFHGVQAPGSPRQPTTLDQAAAYALVDGSSYSVMTAGGGITKYYPAVGYGGHHYGANLPESMSQASYQPQTMTGCQIGPHYPQFEGPHILPNSAGFPINTQVQSTKNLEFSSQERLTGSETATPQKPMHGGTNFDEAPASTPSKVKDQLPILLSCEEQASKTLQVNPIGGLAPPFFPSDLQSFCSSGGLSPALAQISGGPSQFDTQIHYQSASTSLQDTQNQYQTPSISRQSATQVQTHTPCSSYQSTSLIQYQTPDNINKIPMQSVYQSLISLSQPTAPTMYQHSSSFGRSMVGIEDPFTAKPFTFSPESQVHGMTGNPFGPSVPLGQIVPITLPLPPPGRVSHQLAKLAPNGTKPSVEVALNLNNLPFVESLRSANPKDHGVIHIANIPYATTRAELIAFVGRNAMICNDTDEPVHVIMDRVSGKTLDAYIELISMKEAVTAVNAKELNRKGGRGGRLGNRFVDLEVCGQDQLMKALFPKAKNVQWNGEIPEIARPNPNDPYNTGFKGFVNSEELVLLVKQVENPSSANFSKPCPQRVYECLISTLVKFPWYMVDYITIGEREDLFQATRSCILVLHNRVNNEDLLINDRLLKRVAGAAFRCPGFTQAQKAELAYICNVDLSTRLAPYCSDWTVFKALGPKPGCEIDVLCYYIALLREATTSPDMATLAERAKSGMISTQCAFGNLTIQYPQDVNYLTFAQVASIEWGVVECLLRKILTKQ